MNKPVVVVGIGELGGVFARGLLRMGHPVYPVTRDMRPSDIVKTFPVPLCVLVAVAEKDLPDILRVIPAPWKDRLCLIQNELLPRDWETHNINNPTVISVWFEKKKGRGCKVLLPSRIYGPHADLFSEALNGLDIPNRILPGEDELLFELVLKNVFVFTINIAGLQTGGSVRTLWSEHRALAGRIANEIIDLQERLTGRTFSRNRLTDGLEAAVNGDPDHKCTGRSAPERLSRVLKMAGEAGLDLPGIMEIRARITIS